MPLYHKKSIISTPHFLPLLHSNYTASAGEMATTELHNSLTFVSHLLADTFGELRDF